MLDLENIIRLLDNKSGKKCKNDFKIVTQNDLQPNILYPEKLSTKYKGRLKHFQKSKMSNT